MKANRHGKNALSDVKMSLFDLLKLVFRRKRRMFIISWFSGVISVDSTCGGVTVSSTKRQKSKTGLHLMIDFWPSSVVAKAASIPV